VRCVADHGADCCHRGLDVVTPDGHRYAAPGRMDCITLTIVGCSCDGGVAVSHPDLGTTTYRCLECGDARVAHD
jgi:hypothetical protein